MTAAKKPEAVEQAELLGAKVEEEIVPFTSTPAFTLTTYVSMSGRDHTLSMNAFTLQELDEKLAGIELWLDSHDAKAKVSGKATIEDGDEMSIDCPQAVVIRRPDARWEIQFFSMYGDKLGEWPTLKLIMPKDELWNQYGEILSAYNLAELPATISVDWKVYYKLGRETGKFDADGNPTRYKDVLRFVEQDAPKAEAAEDVPF